MTGRCTLLVLLTGLCGGCTTKPKPIYYWGHYEALVYQDYSTPGKTAPAEQIETLKADLEKAKAENLPAPPGLHAHLGYLYFKSGKTDLALQEFQVEKTLFPESAAFVDSLLARSKATTAKP